MKGDVPVWAWVVAIPGVVGTVIRWIIGGVSIQMGEAGATLNVSVAQVSGYEVSTIVGVIFAAIVLREWKGPVQ